jgi:hypothetical protein
MVPLDRSEVQTTVFPDHVYFFLNFNSIFRLNLIEVESMRVCFSPGFLSREGFSAGNLLLRGPTVELLSGAPFPRSCLWWSAAVLLCGAVNTRAPRGLLNSAAKGVEILAAEHI